MPLPHSRKPVCLIAATAQRFVDCILSQGGSRDALDAFVAFRGRKPDVRPLLRQHGIAA